MPSKDRKLVRELTSGHRSAYVEAVECNYSRIYAFLYRMSEDRSVAEDLTQETFAAAWRSLDQFEARSAFGTWLHKIALNVFRDYRRHSRIDVAPTEEYDLPAVPDHAPALIEEIASEQLQQRVQVAVGELPDIYREAVILRCYQGLKYREVAELLGVPIGTVQFRVHVALEKLRAALRGEVPDCETNMVQRVSEP